MAALDRTETVAISRLLRRLRAAAGDFADGAHDPWS
jgi:hypothetical protein